ncbi:hypothetical protein FKM82_007697 [Ascaphus truei]
MEEFGDPDRVLTFLQEVEEKAEDVLADRRQIVDLDVKRNRNREALRALHTDLTPEKVTVCFGNMFITLPKKQTKEMIEKGECSAQASEVRGNGSLGLTRYGCWGVLGVKKNKKTCLSL